MNNSPTQLQTIYEITELKKQKIDTPKYSKIERGDRRAKREQVIKLAEYLHQDEKEMQTLWLADKFIDAVEDEQERDLCNDAIIVAQEKIKTL